MEPVGGVSLQRTQVRNYQQIGVYVNRGSFKYDHSIVVLQGTMRTIHSYCAFGAARRSFLLQAKQKWTNVWRVV